MLKFQTKAIKKDNSGKMNNNYKIALLIDCDNVSHQSIDPGFPPRTSSRTTAGRFRRNLNAGRKR